MGVDCCGRVMSAIFVVFFFWYAPYFRSLFYVIYLAYVRFSDKLRVLCRLFVRVVTVFKYFVAYDWRIHAGIRPGDRGWCMPYGWLPFSVVFHVRLSCVPDTHGGECTMLRRPYRWSAFNEFEDLQRQMDQLMNWASSTSPAFALPESEQQRGLAPIFREGWAGGFQVDVTEDENDVIVTADMMPGIEKENISMELLSPRALEITCERKEEREMKSAEEEEEAGRYYLHERKYGSMSRVIPLPKAVNPENAKASFRNGVLEVRLPVSALETQRRIAIE